MWPNGYDVFAEPECQRAALQSPPDMAWTASHWHVREVVPTPFTSIRIRRVGQNIRVGGVLNIAFESNGLYQSWGDDKQRVGFVNVRVSTL